MAAPIVRYRKLPSGIGTMEWAGGNYMDIWEFTQYQAIQHNGELRLWNNQEKTWFPCPAGHHVARSALGETFEHVDGAP